MCPKGDDPLTLFTDYYSITITVAAIARSYTGYLKFSFQTQSLSIPQSGWTDQNCQKAFEALPNIRKVRCTIQYSSSRYGGFVILVQFIEFPIIPYLNNVYTNDGKPALSDFVCETKQINTLGTVTCVIEEVAVNTIPGIDYYYVIYLCNNRTCL